MAFNRYVNLCMLLTARESVAHPGHGLKRAHTGIFSF